MARAELELRPALTAVFRALRSLAEGAGALDLEAALAGEGSYPRSAVGCGRVLRVLGELGLVDVDLGAPSCTVVEGVRSDLELHPRTAPTARASSRSSARWPANCSPPRGQRRRRARPSGLGRRLGST